MLSNWNKGPRQASANVLNCDRALIGSILGMISEGSAKHVEPPRSHLLWSHRFIDGREAGPCQLQPKDRRANSSGGEDNTSDALFETAQSIMK